LHYFYAMKNASSLLIFILFSIISCKEKTKEEPKSFISVLSLIEKQVAHIDTSLYSIVKIVYSDTLHKDSSYIPREEFRALAKDFLEIPDLSNQKIARHYKEATNFDEMLNRVIITYTPLKPAEQEIQKQEILVTPDIATGDRVNTIIIESVISNKDGYQGKKMLWQMDKSFLVTKTTQKPGQPEQITNMKVTWNEANNP